MPRRPSALRRAAAWLRDARRSDPWEDLPDGWTAMPEPRGSGRVVTGPGGVFLVRRGGSSVSPSSVRLGEVARAARDVGVRLTAATGGPVAVHPVLVIDGDVQPASQPQGVAVVSASLVRPWLLSHAAVLPVNDVSRVARALRGLVVAGV